MSSKRLCKRTKSSKRKWQFTTAVHYFGHRLTALLASAHPYLRAVSTHHWFYHFSCNSAWEGARAEKNAPVIYRFKPHRTETIKIKCCVKWTRQLILLPSRFSIEQWVNAVSHGTRGGTCLLNIMSTGHEKKHTQTSNIAPKYKPELGLAK